MEAYTGFAQVYDQFMNNVPYEEWAEDIAALLFEHGITEGLMLELGCGTGILTEMMAKKGFDMIGVDSSEDMLAEAMDKKYESGHDILYLCQDMRSFELFGTVAAAFCVCDSINYILHPRELVEVFRLVNNYLDPGGIFILDFNTEAEYESPLRWVPIVETDQGDTMIWENTYHPEKKINHHRVTFFLEGEDGRYDKIEEFHRQRAYSQEEIKTAMEAGGLEVLAVYAAGTRQDPEQTTTRIYMIAREKGK